LEQAAVLSALLTVGATMFVAELGDKDALFLLTLATKRRPLWVFAAGSLAFTLTAAIIVLVGSAIVSLVPVAWVKLAGGAIMVGYALWEYSRGAREAEEVERREKGLLERKSLGWMAFAAAVASLMVLDLAGDATELLIVVFVAQYQEILLVFVASVVGLVAATAVETILGNRLGGLLSTRRIRYLSVVVFLVIGSVVIASALLSPTKP
jgi:putative Ca2+/H+ antiporter (TMEM165/GDT1 family)